MGQSSMDNPEILATLATQYTGQINVREYRWDNQEWIIQGYWQRWSLKIPEEIIIIRNSKKDRQHNGQKKKGQNDKQRSPKQTHKTKDRVARTPLKTRSEQ
jgi:hypothetical protein